MQSDVPITDNVNDPCSLNNYKGCQVGEYVAKFHDAFDSVATRRDKGLDFLL